MLACGGGSARDLVLDIVDDEGHNGLVGGLVPFLVGCGQYDSGIMRYRNAVEGDESSKDNLKVASLR